MRLYGAATLDWHMNFMRPIYPRWDQPYAESLLQRFDLKREQKIKGLSHGQRVKAALLLALARRPRLLVLDEPTTGLDPVARVEVLQELMAVLADEDRTILFLVAQHAGRGADFGSDHVHRPRPHHRLRRQRGVSGPLAAIAAGAAAGRRGSAPARDCGSGRKRPSACAHHQRFEPAMVSACNQMGATVQAVDTDDAGRDFCSQRTQQKGAENSMNYSMVMRLIGKDWYFQRTAILLSLAGGALSLGIVAFGGQAGFTIGLVLLVTIMAMIGAMMVMGNVIGERENQTLPFVMSLPISYLEYTASKILSNLIIFVPFWLGRDGWMPWPDSGRAGHPWSVFLHRDYGSRDSGEYLHDDCGRHRLGVEGLDDRGDHGG